MSRTTVNFWLDILLLLLFITLLGVSVITQFLFPPGTNAAGWTLWGAGYDRWCEWQFGVLVAMSLAILIHVMLHWTWVCGVVAAMSAHRTGKKKSQWDNGTKTIVGVAVIIVILNVVGGILAAAAVMIQRPGI